MIKLNLISAQLKNKIELKRLYAFIKKMNYSFLILTMLVTVILLSAKIILQYKFDQTVAATSLVTKSGRSYSTKVREINQKINFITQIQKEFINWSRVITDLAKQTTNDIVLYSIKINGESSDLAIRGHANQRDDLLNLKSSLEADKILGPIELPLENILLKEDINFEIKTKLKLEEIKNE